MSFNFAFDPAVQQTRSARAEISQHVRAGLRPEFLEEAGEVAGCRSILRAERRKIHDVVPGRSKLAQQGLQRRILDVDHARVVGDPFWATAEGQDATVGSTL